MRFYKQGQFLPTFNQKITILNKLAAADNIEKIDKWYKTVIDGCSWKTKTTRTASNATVSIANSVICRIPFQSNYKAYNQWIDDIENTFTISVGDYIVLGEVAQEVTANNIISIIKNCKPGAIQVKAVADNTTIEGAKHFKVEGV